MTIETSLSCEQLEERLAALHRASLELVQEISLDSLLERIACIACEQAQANYTVIGVKEDGRKDMRIISAGREGGDIVTMSQLPLDLSMLGIVAGGGESIRVNYIQKKHQLESFPEMTTLMGVPIRLGGLELGQLHLVDKLDGETFTLDDERVIETLAAYAAVAISNARSYNELHERDRALTRRNQDLALLNNLASMLAAITEVDKLLDTALERVIKYFHIDVGEIYLSGEGYGTLSKVRQRGAANQSIWEEDPFSLKGTLIEQTVSSGLPVIVNLPYPDDPILRNQALLASGITQVACFPLTSRSEVLGVMSIAIGHDKSLDEIDQQLLSSIASWVGTTLENVQLNIQGRRLAVLEERERIGMDLHDGIIQSIYAVGLTLEHARLLLGEDQEQTRKSISQSIEDLNSTIRDLRSFIMDMRPRQLYEENLMDGLQRLIDEFRANSLVEVKLSGPSKRLDSLSDAHAVALFHICQEALANVAKHAQAKIVEVQVWTAADRILMEIHDDGHGFNPQKIHLSLGHGISNMQTRVRNVGGDLEITTDPDGGTTILAWMPYPHALERNALE
ncbi:MAG: GAF domain-containing sensor histidine kinase [Chloroflexota bacterium]|nr:GAF domain-containing sensor histidine kinase [Chloroflexota bacterium]